MVNSLAPRGNTVLQYSRPWFLGFNLVFLHSLSYSALACGQAPDMLRGGRRMQSLSSAESVGSRVGGMSSSGYVIAWIPSLTFFPLIFTAIYTWWCWSIYDGTWLNFSHVPEAMVSSPETMVRMWGNPLVRHWKDFGFDLFNKSWNKVFV